MKTAAFKLAFRNIKKNKLSSFINIFGFAVGITSVVIIGLWIQQQRSFDKFNKNYKNLYRITIHDTHGKEEPMVYVPTTFARAFYDELPEVTGYVSFFRHNESVFKKDDISFFESNGLYTDNTIFQLFDFPLINGQKEEALIRPFSIALNETMAHKYFGNENPVGEIIEIDKTNYTITAVFQNLPYNSHIQADYFLSVSSFSQIWNGYYDWNSNRVNAYILVDETANIENLNIKIKQVVSSHTTRWDELGYEIKLQPFKDVYLGYQYPASDRFKFGDKRNLYIFMFVGIAILLISCLNYINLFKAQNLGRRKEIGISKIIGAQRKNIIGLFISETGIHIFLAIFISVLLIISLKPYINQLTEMSITLKTLISSTILYLIVAVLFICFLTGFLPAVSFSNLKPISVLSKKLMNSKALNAKNGLVVFQFCISIVLIVCTLVALKQKNYLMNKNLGFDKEHVLFMPMPQDRNYDYQIFKEKLLHEPLVTNVSAKVGNPRDWYDGGNYWTTGGFFEENHNAERCWIDFDYIETMNINIINGRSFSKEYSSDGREAIILNQKAVDELGIKDPLGKEIFFNDERRIIIGVTENILTKSLKGEVYPQLYILRNGGWYSGSVIMVKVNGNVREAISSTEKSWKEYYKGYPFRYEFLDQLFGQFYEKEIKLSIMFKVFTLIAIILSALGILGLAFFDSQFRIKEIGIRKVNGARVFKVMAHLSQNYVKWVIIAYVLATPISWLIMNKWLENFAYKTNLSWWIFAVSGLVALGVALLTVSWQSWRAATRNPVEALRYE